MVFAELLNAFSKKGPKLRRAVAKAIDALGKRMDVVIVPQTPEQFSQATKSYEQAADKNWSLTDCASFRIMRDKKITTALTHDRHFAQAGFETLLR